MAEDKTYNGHKNWSHWNVSLWISNEESVYRRAIELKRKHGALRAAKLLLAELPSKTPDGASFSITNLYAAIDDLE